MEILMASNRYTTHIEADHASVTNPKGDVVARLLPETFTAITETVLARNDARLGRKRDSKFPDYSVYPLPKGTAANQQVIIVLCESNPPFSKIIYENEMDDNDNWEPYQVARRYFERHPVLEDIWWDAEPGEIWELELVDGSTKPFIVGINLPGEHTARFIDPTNNTNQLYASDDAIASGKLIWSSKS